MIILDEETSNLPTSECIWNKKYLKKDIRRSERKHVWYEQHEKRNPREGVLQNIKKETNKEARKNHLIVFFHGFWWSFVLFSVSDTCTSMVLVYGNPAKALESQNAEKMPLPTPCTPSDVHLKRLAPSVKVCLFVCFVALRPKSTAMVMAGRSVHLITLFPEQAWTSS